MSAAARTNDPRAARVVACYESMSPDDLGRLEAIYTPDCRFRDPFNDVQGVAALRRIFEHMFATLDAPGFVVREVIVEDDRCFLTWDFSFERRGSDPRTFTIHGGSYLRFAPDGRVADHRDYWDAAGELYERLPVIGALMRWLRRRLGA